MIFTLKNKNIRLLAFLMLTSSSQLFVCCVGHCTLNCSLQGNNRIFWKRLQTTLLWDHNDKFSGSSGIVSEKQLIDLHLGFKKDFWVWENLPFPIDLTLPLLFSINVNEKKTSSWTFEGRQKNKEVTCQAEENGLLFQVKS